MEAMCSPGSSAQSAAQSLIGGREFLGLNSRFTYRGHEIRVPDPARQNVQMQVPGDAGSRGPPDVHSEIVSVRAIKICKSFFDPLRQRHHFRESFRLGSRKRGLMRIRNHHHVSRGIGVAVQDHEIFPGAQDDQGLGIIAPFRCGAKNTRLVFHASGDIAVPPGRPELIHDDGDYSGGVWGGTAAAAAAVSPLTKSLSSLLGLKKGMRLGGTSTLAPVFGFRPTRPRRWRVRKLPKPRISILSPVCRAAMMLSKIVSTMISDSLRGSSVTRTTSSTKSALVIVESFMVVYPAILSPAVVISAPVRSAPQED